MIIGKDWCEMAIIQFGSRLRELRNLVNQSMNGHEPVEKLPSVGLVFRQAINDMCAIRGCSYDKRNDIRSKDEIDTSGNQIGD